MSRITMVRYTVKADRAEENEQYIRNVFAQLVRDTPLGIHYASFKLDDGVSFVHIVSQEDAPTPLKELAAFKEFTASIKDRCAVPPVAVQLSEVGSYRFFADRHPAGERA